MKVPCGKVCQKRSAECKKTCEKWAEYEAWKFEEYERKRIAYEQEQDYWDYHVRRVATSIKKVKR